MIATLEAREPVARYLATPPLLQHFDRVAQAPGGIARLRELILTLAVQGKLVRQDPADEPASVLLERIRAEKARVLSEGKIRKEKPLAAITEEEKPFALPAGWEWVRLPDIYYSISPSSNKLLSSSVQEEGAYPVVDQGKRYIAGYTDIASLLICLPGPVVIFGDHTTERKYVDFDFVAGADGVKILRPLLLNEKFFFHQLLGYRLEDRGYARHFKVLNSQLFALPPVAEQSRIVARVEELMAVCDTLEETGRLAAVQHERLAGALFDALANSATAEETAENWQRIAPHFDLLLDRTSTVDRLEQTILQLAVRGRLVPQNPADEPAITLLQKIRQEKDHQIAAGKIKRDKPLPPINDEEKPFELPEGWEWARFPELGEFGRGKSKHRPRNDPRLFNPGKYPLVQTGEVARADQVISEYHSKYSEEGLAQSKMWPKGTLCITIAANIADTAMLGFDACFPDSVVGFVPAPIIGNTEYFLAFMATARERLLEFAPATAQKNINLEILSSVLIPIPPIREMREIVSRITELRTLCAELHQRLASIQQTQSRLAETLIESVVA